MGTRTGRMLALATMAVCTAGCRPSPPPTDTGQTSAGRGRTSGASRDVGSGRVLTAPAIGSLVLLDHRNKRVNFPVLVVGAGSGAFLARASTVEVTNEEVVETTLPGEASMTYLPLQLGDIRGFRPVLHLYGLGADERLSAVIAEMAPRARGVIVAETHAGDSDAAARTVAGALAEPTVPAALLGTEELAKLWSTLGGPTPVFVGAAHETSVSPALKSVARQLLRQLASAGTS